MGLWPVALVAPSKLTLLGHFLKHKPPDRHGTKTEVNMFLKCTFSSEEKLETEIRF